MLMKKIIVLGSTGMLGHMVLKVLTRNKEWDIQGASSKDFNVEQFTETESPLQRRLGLLTSNDYIINCIGVLTGDDEEKMKKVNAEFPHQLAKSTSAKIIHMSTDGVFSGHHSPSPPPPPTPPPPPPSPNPSHRGRGIFAWFLPIDGGGQEGVARDIQ